MFDLDLTKKILKIKEDELTSIQTNDPNNKTAIEAIEKEVNYLKTLIARYKIAVLLKLDKDTTYFNNNYLGIEEEDVNEFNLSSEDLVEYNNLIAQLPKEQLPKYKIRKQMAEILGENGEKFKKNEYVGVENINPSMVKYNLNSQQITEFNNLVSKLNAMDKDSITYVDLNQEQLKISKDKLTELKKAFNELNVEDMTVYENLKDSNMKKIDDLITQVEENEKKDLFKDINNYQFAFDLSSKYENMSIELGLNGVKNLLSELEFMEVTDPKYADYIELFCSNVNRLYSDDNNKKDIESLINSIGKYNYTLRYDLSTHLSAIKDTHLKLEDDEVETLFRKLDIEYNGLADEEKDKCLKMLSDKINKESENLDKVGDLNKLFKSATNDAFSEKLESMVNKNENIEFGHQHKSSYQILIEEQIKKIDNKILMYEVHNPKTSIMREHYDIKIKELEREKEKLKNLELEFSKNIVLNKLDSVYDKNTDKSIQIQREIAELEKLKETVNSKFHQKKIDQNLMKRKLKMYKLKNSRNRLIGIQKKIMLPKVWVNQKKGMIERSFDARVEVGQNYAEDYAKMAELYNNLDGMFNGIKASFYEFKSGRYQSKAEFNQKVCDMLNNAKVTVKGSNRTSISKNLLDKIRQNQQQQIQTQAI